MLSLLSPKAQGRNFFFRKALKPSRACIHCIALYARVKLVIFQFRHIFVLVKLATTSIRDNIITSIISNSFYLDNPISLTIEMFPQSFHLENMNINNK